MEFNNFFQNVTSIKTYFRKTKMLLMKCYSVGL